MANQNRLRYCSIVENVHYSVTRKKVPNVNVSQVIHLRLMYIGHILMFVIYNYSRFHC